MNPPDVRFQNVAAVLGELCEDPRYVALVNGTDREYSERFHRLSLEVNHTSSRCLNWGRDNPPTFEEISDRLDQLASLLTNELSQFAHYIDNARRVLIA